jgi:hypothetical protein
MTDAPTLDDFISGKDLADYLGVPAFDLFDVIEIKGASDRTPVRFQQPAGRPRTAGKHPRGTDGHVTAGDVAGSPAGVVRRHTWQEST